MATIETIVPLEVYQQFKKFCEENLTEYKLSVGVSHLGLKVTIHIENEDEASFLKLTWFNNE